MDILNTLFTGPAGKWVAAREAEQIADMAFCALIFGGHDNDDKEYPGILPGRDAGAYTYDLCDWSGISLEFRKYEGEPPNADELTALFALGFTVIRIDYLDKARWTTQHAFHGDWWCVKGEEPREGKPMVVGVDPCPTHFSSATGNGPCAFLAGHDGDHEHAR